VKLADLEPVFLRLTDGGWTHVHTIGEAQGVIFLCPGCYLKNKNKVGVHSVICLFKNCGVPDDREPLPGRWTASGANLANLTLRDSVSLECWHGYITDGKVATL
jgi:hypothetical protein